MTLALDRRFLAAAVRLGRAQLGTTAPNPAVGCLLVRDGIVVGAGATGAGGRPHGETLALDDAGEKARGATAYVSLEPCNHHGKTGPCTLALTKAGVARVVIALGDPDPRVSGSGAQALRDAGMVVSFEPFADIARAARRAHAGHIMRMQEARPHITLKLALSADGAIGVPGQGQVPITAPRTNALMHGLRTRMDAIAVGAGTWRADSPQLTVRLPGLEARSPKRFVFGVVQAQDDLSVLTGQDLAGDVQTMASQGITRLLVEGGGQLATSFLQAGLVDRLILLRGAAKLGSSATRPFAGNPFDDLTAAGLGDWVMSEKRSIGDDRMLVLGPQT